MRLQMRVFGLGLAIFGYGALAGAQTTTATAPAAQTGASVDTSATATGSATVNTAATPAADTTPAPPAPVSTPQATTTDTAPAVVAPPPTSFVPLKLESPNATIKFGLLAQPQFDVVGNSAPAVGGASYNLFVRRTRLLVGGTLFGKFEYFFDTDSPNLFKGTGTTGTTATGAKPAPVIGVQDVLVTYKAYEDMFKIDAGYMLVPGAHNALQGAGTLYGLDYFSYSFLHANAFNSAGDVGRDTGVEARGVVADGHLEYRLGLFQGLRRPATLTDPASRNMFRVAGRVQINVFDPETSFFYAGSYLGTKRVLSFGAAYDTQNSYHHWAVDGFLDMPLGDAGALTAQVNFAKWNGGDFLVNTPAMAGGPTTPALPNQTAIMAEAGYRFAGPQISPIVRIEHRNMVNPGIDETRYGIGLAYWPYAHNINLKAFFQHIAPKAPAGTAIDSYNQFTLQWQLYFY